jgi:hypothetical protein
MDLLCRLLAAIDEGMSCRALAASRGDAEDDLRACCEKVESGFSQKSMR